VALVNSTAVTFQLTDPELGPCLLLGPDGHARGWLAYDTSLTVPLPPGRHHLVIVWMYVRSAIEVIVEDRAAQTVVIARQGMDFIVAE
jgi:hypothetical protein